MICQPCRNRDCSNCADCCCGHRASTTPGVRAPTKQERHDRALGRHTAKAIITPIRINNALPSSNGHP